MAVEQRIGRIHRFGQKDVSQVYNLVAKDTVEDRIYGLLTNKLLSIAQAIGKTDPDTGEPLEDFRTEILGYLGSSPNYQQLFRQALLDKDYTRTGREIEEMMRQAQEARDPLSQLSQDLTHFNLDHYRKITGQFHLAQLGLWCREAVVRLGGSVLPTGDFWQIVTPDCLKGFSQVNPQYDMVTFDRALSTRTKKCELFGIGHPLVDALLTYLQNAPFDADTAFLPAGGGKTDIVEARYRVTWNKPEQPTSSSVVGVILNGAATVDESSLDPDRLASSLWASPKAGVVKSEQEAEESIRIWIASRRTEMPQGTITRCELLGLSCS